VPRPRQNLEKVSRTGIGSQLDYEDMPVRRMMVDSDIEERRQGNYS